MARPGRKIDLWPLPDHGGVQVDQHRRDLAELDAEAPPVSRREGLVQARNVDIGALDAEPRNCGKIFVELRRKLKTREGRVNIRLDLLAWTAAAAMAVLPATALAAVDSFIWFEGGPGNSTDDRHKGWFEIKDFSFAVQSSAAVGSATRGAESGKAKAKEFTIKRVSDSASPAFFRQAVSSGRHFPVVKIEMRKAGGDPHQFADYVFTNVLISKMEMSGSGDKGPEESITFVRRHDGSVRHPGPRRPNCPRAGQGLGATTRSQSTAAALRQCCLPWIPGTSPG